MWWWTAVAQDVVTLTAESEPGVVALEDPDAALVVPLDDPELDLAAFVVATPEGEVILDELVVEAKGMLGNPKIGDVKFVYNMSQAGKAAPTGCVTVFGLQACP